MSNWEEITKRISRLAEEVQKIVSVVEDARSQLADVSSKLILKEKEYNLLVAQYDSIFRSTLEDQNKKYTEKMIERAILRESDCQRVYNELHTLKAKKEVLEQQLKSLETRLRGVSILLRLAELDSSYFTKIADPLAKFDGSDILKQI